MEEITINLEKIALMPDDSVTDAETIRQIALHAIQTNDNELVCKIKKGFEVAGLYPHIIKSYNEKIKNVEKYQHASTDDMIKFLDMVKELKTFTIRNQDYEGACALRILEKAILDSLHK